jgi:hypothetical protein
VGPEHARGYKKDLNAYRLLHNVRWQLGAVSGGAARVQAARGDSEEAVREVARAAGQAIAERVNRINTGLGMPKTLQPSDVANTLVAFTRSRADAARRATATAAFTGIGPASQGASVLIPDRRRHTGAQQSPRRLREAHESLETTVD